MNPIIAKAPANRSQKVGEDTQHNVWLTTDEVKAYGLVGQIVERISEVE